MKRWHFIVGVLFLAIYVLSFGPACNSYMLEDGTFEFPPILEAIYFPIQWSSKHLKIVDRTFSWYRHRWTPRKEARSVSGYNYREMLPVIFLREMRRDDPPFSATVLSVNTVQLFADPPPLTITALSIEIQRDDGSKVYVDDPNPTLLEMQRANRLIVGRKYEFPTYFPPRCLKRSQPAAAE